MNKRALLGIDDVFEQAKEVLRKDKHHANIVIAFDVNKVPKIMALDFSDDESKDASLEMLRKFIADNKIEVYYFISEGWMTVNSGDMPFIRPSLSKNRIQILMVSGFWKDMKTEFKAVEFDIVHNKVKFGKELSEDFTDMASRWNVFLEKEGVEERLAKVNKAVINKLAKKLARKVVSEFKDENFSEEVFDKMKVRVGEELAKIKTKLENEVDEDVEK